jgi:gliding motility-associated-like protein
MNTANQMVNSLLGQGIQVSNVTFSGTNLQAGYFNSTNTSPYIGFDNGVILTTGKASYAIGPNNTTDNYNEMVSGATDADLLKLLNVTETWQINDACILEFDFVPITDTIQFRYIFGSEEYYSFTCDQFNDVFGFFLSGPGINGAFSNNSINIALVPGKNIPVAINTINSGEATYSSNEHYCSDIDPDWVSNSIYYHNNPIGTNASALQYNGYTTVLTAKARVTPCQVHHIKLAIADAYDKRNDSGVFIEAGSFSAVGVSYSNYISDASSSLTESSNVTESCTNAVVSINLTNGAVSTPTEVSYTISGTAQNGVDYSDENGNALSGTITIPAYQDSALLHINPIADNITEGNETIIITFSTIYDCSGLTTNESDTIYVSDASSGLTVVCGTSTNNSIQISWNDIGATSYNISWTTSDGNSGSANNITGTSYTIQSLNSGVSVDIIVSPNGLQGGCIGNGTVTCTTVGIPPCNASIATPQQLTCTTTQIQLNASASTGNAIIYNWNTSNGLIVSGANTSTPTISEAGTYTLYISASGCLDTADVIVSSDTISPTPTIIASGATTFCQGGNVTLSTQNTYSSYLWSTTQTSSSIIVIATSTLNVTVTATNGCTGTNHISVTVNPNPTPTITYNGSLSFCAGNSITLNAGNYSSYSWSNGQNTSSINVSTSGNYNVTVTNNGCSGSSSSVTVTVIPNPIVSISASNGLTICEGKSTTLTSSSSTGNSWSTGATTSSINVITAGVYTLTVTSGTCTNSSSATVVVNSLPVISLPAIVEICENDEVTLDAQNSGSSYLWSTAQTSQTIEVSNQGFYYVTVTNSHSCVDSAKVFLQVNSLPIVDAGNDTTIIKGNNITLNPYITGNTELAYQWIPDLFLNNSTLSNPNSEPEEDIVYTLLVTDENECVASDSISIHVKTNDLIIYNVITPNNDGKNEKWIIENISNYRNNKVYVFNRNGNKLYEAENYNNETAFWNAVYSGKPVPAGTYYYLIDIGDNHDLIKGYLTIVR